MPKLLGQEWVGHRLERHWLHTNDIGHDVITIETIEDVEPILKANQADYNNAPGRFERKRDDALGKKVARIPGTVLEEICRIHKIKFRELMGMKTPRSISILNRVLNDPAFCKLRCAPGRVDLGRHR